MRGFTLLEFLLVIGGVIIIALLTVPLGVKFYTTQVFDEAASDIFGALRRAQSQSMFQKNDSVFGVKFFSDSYVIFQGNSYASRTPGEDENFSLPAGITTSGIDEIVFAKLTGAPGAPTTLAIDSADKNKNITINVQGKIDLQ